MTINKIIQTKKKIPE